MARKKELNKPKQISLLVEEAKYDKLNTRVPNISKFLRECIDNYINIDNSLTDLKIELNHKLNERNSLNVEIEILESQIKELETTLKENENNNNIIVELMQTVKNVSKNEFNNNGITKDRLNAIANNKIDVTLLIKECRKQDINIIKPGKVTNSTIKETKNNSMDPVIKIAKSFYREFNNQYNKAIYGNDVNKFFDNKKNEDKYILMCNRKEVNFKEFKSYVLSHAQ